MDGLNVSSNVSDSGVIDYYTRIGFKPLENISQLKVGMMIQVVENNKRPLHWEWKEVDERVILAISKLTEDKLKFVRLPNY